MTPNGVHPWVAQRSSGISFAVQAFPTLDDPRPADTIRAAGLLAEEVGLDGFLIPDHPGTHIDPWMHLSAVAALTERVTLGSVVNCVYHRHPALLARMAADLNQISHGRLMLGLGIGWNAPEFAQLGMALPPVPERQSALDEAMTIISGMFGPDPLTFAGEHWSVEGASVRSAEGSYGIPPVMIAGAGNRTLQQVVRWADICNFGSSRNTGNVQGDDEARARLELIDELCLAAGRAPESVLRSHFTSWLMMGETESAAEAKLARYFPNGLTEEQTRTRIYGDPAKIIDHFRGLLALGFRYFVVQVQDASDLETIRLLGEAVAPTFA